MSRDDSCKHPPTSPHTRDCPSERRGDTLLAWVMRVCVVSHTICETFLNLIKCVSRTSNLELLHTKSFWFLAHKIDIMEKFLPKRLMWLDIFRTVVSIAVFVIIQLLVSNHFIFGDDQPCKILMRLPMVTQNTGQWFLHKFCDMAIKKSKVTLCNTLNCAMLCNRHSKSVVTAP
jgi:hypothetical protein